jgi:hypothetical protein
MVIPTARMVATIAWATVGAPTRLRAQLHGCIPEPPGHSPDVEATAAMVARYGCVFVEPLATATPEAEEARRQENALPVVVRFSQAPLQGAGSA